MNNYFISKIHLIIRLFKYMTVPAMLFFTLNAFSVESITVISDDNYPPYIFRDESGKLKGIIVDQWDLWSKKTGVNVHIVATDWSDALKLMSEGRGDVIDTVFYTAERAAKYDYTPEYADIEVPVFFENSLSGIDSIESLSGYIVGVKDGDACIEILNSHGITSLKKYPNYESIVKDAAAGKIHIFCADKPPALFYIYKYKIENLFRYSLTLNTGQFHRAVKKGNRSVLNLVNEGFNKITDEEYIKIDRKWFGSEIKYNRLEKYFIPVLSGFIGFAAFMILVSLYLKVKIRRKTAELRETVNKLKSSEEKNRALLMANPDLLFIFDSGYNFIDYKAEVNDELYAEPADFIGKNIKEVLPRDLAELTIKKIELVNKTGRMQSYEYDIELGGEKIFFDSRLLKFGENTFLAIVRNISEKKKRDEETIRSHKLESLGIFAGGIAHDFNNILSAIVGYISLARMKIDNKDKAVELLDEAEKSGLRARHLTEQLLAFSKGGNPVKEITNVIDVVKESADFIMSGSKTALNYNVEPDVLKADIDRGQIGQVIQNIILNASQAMPSGGVIYISIRNQYMKDENVISIPEGTYVAIEIKDEGSGIESRNLKRIFDPYFTTKKDGNGLGLTICHSIVKRHGGGIEVESVPGKGTEFTIYLPACNDVKSDKKTASAPKISINLKNLSVIIMDDEPQLRYIMKEVLNDEGAKIFTVSDGSEAIDLFEKMASSGEPADLIIADLTIPGGMGGLEAIRIIREQGLPFKAIVISGYSNDPVMSDFKNYGFDAYIAKPFTSEDLLAVVKKVFEK
ncbi:MAG TPA: transporter substrate-binding domain-containing protein [Spirochaetota bacterium]|nr:transporter substrate-binding domain-containing protein [Spirochaetota bacterium]